MDASGADNLLGTGQHHEWPSAVVLRAFLRRYPALVHHRRVLELGSGLGTCGMAAVEAGAAQVVFSDAEEAVSVLSRLRLGVGALPRVPPPTSGLPTTGGAATSPSTLEDRLLFRYRVLGLTWGRLPADLMRPDAPSPQVLLAADCLYDSTQFEDFVASVSFLLHRDPTALLVMTYQYRRNVGSLLREYGLTACIVPLEDFMDQADIDHLSTHIELSIMKACQNDQHL